MNKPLPQRRHVFIKKSFQGRFIFGALAIILFSALCSALLIYWITGDELRAQSLSVHAVINNAGERLGLSIMLGNAVSILVAGGIAVVSVLYASHKIAGPLYRFETLCKDVGNGKLDTVTQLRANDQLRELEKSFSDMVVKLRDKRDRRAELMAGISDLVLNLKISDNLPPEDRKSLIELTEAVKQLSQLDDKNVH